MVKMVILASLTSLSKVLLPPNLWTTNIRQKMFFNKINTLINKAGYTATPVACGWAGAVLEKVTRPFGQELKKLKNAENVTRGPTDRPTDRRIDKAGCKVA